ncbi:MAG: PEP-CTERM sorting domain-containing protein [Phycisphaerae bacterium]
MLALRTNRLLAATFVTAVLTVAASGAMYSGSLSTEDGGLLGTGAWGDGPSTLSWTVELVEGPIWEYTYTLEVPSKGISHFILELSADFEWEKMESPSLWVNGEEVYWPDVEAAIASYGTDDPANPNIPGDVYGIKVDLDDDNGDPLVVTFSFQTLRDPVWGDFYAKDGVDPGEGEWVALWNAGFTDPDEDPFDFPADGALDGHLLVPDTTEVPEPATLAVLAFGGMGALVLRRRGR